MWLRSTSKEPRAKFFPYYETRDQFCHLLLTSCPSANAKMRVGQRYSFLLTLTLIPKDEVFPNTYYVFSPLIPILSSQTNIKTTILSPWASHILIYPQLLLHANSLLGSKPWSPVSVTDGLSLSEPLGGERILSLSWGV